MRLDFHYLLHESDLDYAAAWFVFLAFLALTLVAIF